MDRPLPALAVVAVLLVVPAAGCTGLAGDGPATASETLTPAAVPEVSSPVAPGVPAPAASGARSAPVDTDRLLAADARARAGTSYRLKRSVDIETRSGDTWMSIRRARNVGADGAVLERLAAGGFGRLRPTVLNSTLWTDGSTVRVRTRLSDDRTVITRRLPAVPTRHRLGLDLRERVLSAGEYRVRSVEGGRAVLVSRGPVSLSRPVVPIALGPPRNVSVRAVVTTEGLIARLVVRYDASYLDERVDVVVRHRVTGVGGTPVRRPAWANATADG